MPLDQTPILECFMQAPVPPVTAAIPVVYDELPFKPRDYKYAIAKVKESELWSLLCDFAQWSLHIQKTDASSYLITPPS